MKLFILLVCVGVTLADRPYIIGGNDVTTVAKYPWQGSLRLYGSHNCGLSLISPTWGVTAAHCVDGSAIKDLSFQFGSNNRTQGGQVVTATKITMHEDYGTGTGSFPNDIAVVQFAEAVTHANAAAIPMADGTTDHAGNSDCWITGWGYTDFWTFELPEILQEAKINVHTNTACKNDWPTNINPGHVCIGDKTNGRGSCNGDSGGPLVCMVDGRYELVGATSWGVFACDTSMPTVYSRVGYFRQWIKDNSGV